MYFDWLYKHLALKALSFFFTIWIINPTLNAALKTLAKTILQHKMYQMKVGFEPMTDGVNKTNTLRVARTQPLIALGKG